MTETHFLELADRHRPFVLGLTGAFGSGCSTVADLITRCDSRYALVQPSGVLRKRLTDQGTPNPTRSQLQDLGNELRKTDGPEAVIQAALRDILDTDSPPECVAIDAIRNLGEVRWLQRVFGERFALMAVYAPHEERFRRYEAVYSSRQQFDDDDARDQGEEVEFGQQVGRCVDNADVFVLNDLELEDAVEREEWLTEKLKRFLPIVEGKGTEYPTQSEVLMNMAFAASHGSRCLKRQVGAVIAKDLEPLATGYNENPDGLLPCVEQFRGRCYRDIVRHDRFTELVEKGFRCPNCGDALSEIPRPPWLCPGCGVSLDRMFFPDRAMRWCTALHAEERAIINARGSDLTGTTLYSTTFPCMLCSEKIIHAGVARVLYVDAYPDESGRGLLAAAGVQLELFEGVRSRNFLRYFTPVQATKEEEAVRKISAQAERLNVVRTSGKAAGLTGAEPASGS